ELIAAAPDHDLAKLDDELERIKWYLWHGNVFRALQVLEGVQWELEDLDEEVRASRKLARTIAEFHTYITVNEAFIPNYGDRYRYGEVISTAFVESTVNQVISKCAVHVVCPSLTSDITVEALAAAIYLGVIHGLVLIRGVPAQARREIFRIQR